MRLGSVRAAAIFFVVVLSAGPGRGQALTVLPVSIEMAPGQMAASLTVIDEGDKETSFQIRPFAWTQPGGTDQLSATEDLLVSPPLGTIAAGARQVVRLVLRRAPSAGEATYRILLDQIPPAAAPGTVRIALRLSIPVFAQPASRAAAQLQWRIETSGGQAYLVAVNSGTRHETVRNIALRSAAGGALQIEANASPYVLAGATRRWRILTGRPVGGVIRLTATGDSGAIDQPVAVDGAR